MIDPEIVDFFKANCCFDASDYTRFHACEQIESLTDYNISHDHLGPSGSAEIVSCDTFENIHSLFLKHSIPHKRKKGIVNLCCDESSERSEWLFTDHFHGVPNMFLKLDADFRMYELWAFPKGDNQTQKDWHFGLSAYCGDCFDYWMDWNKEQASEKLSHDWYKKRIVAPEDFVISPVVNLIIVPSVDYNYKAYFRDGLFREDFVM